MKSDQIYVKNDGTGREKALDMTEEMALSQSLSVRESRYLRLLVEETLGMVQAIADEFEAQFWLENEGKAFRVCLMARTTMYPEKRNELISLSTKGKNDAYKGIMGKIRGLFEAAVQGYDEVNRINMEAGLGPVVTYGMSGADTTFAMGNAVAVWSLQKYRTGLEEAGGTDEIKLEAMDELERSIVASIADDVRVGIRRDNVELTIFKDFGAVAK